jgi:hypothetical protein
MPKATTAPWGQISPAFVRRPLEKGGFRFQGSGFVPSLARALDVTKFVFSFSFASPDLLSTISYLLIPARVVKWQTRTFEGRMP